MTANRDVVRQLVREMGVPFLIAAGWTGYSLVVTPAKRALVDAISVFSGSFFLACWAFAQWFRVKKQQAVESGLGGIVKKQEALVAALTEATERLEGHASGGKSIGWLMLSRPRQGAIRDVTAHVEGDYPLIDASVSILDLANTTSVRASEIDEIKQSPRWRVHLQSSLYKNLTDQCSAQFFTPFFIRPERGHGDFWLLHLAQHWKARDVMASTHWQHHNHFSQYGDAGFHMFSTGYISKIDDEHKLQAGFDFSELAATVSKETMMEQIPSMLFEGAEGMTFEQFFLKLINTTPATRDMVEATLLQLHQVGEIIVVDETGDPSKARVSLKPNHVLRLPSQRSFPCF